MKIKFISLITAMLFLTLTHPIFAQDNAEESERQEFFETFLNENKEFHRFLNTKTERVFRLTHPQCTDDVALTRVQPTILEQIEIRPEAREIDLSNFDETEAVKQKALYEKNKALNGIPQYGQWIERVNASACDKNVLINHVAVAYKDASPVLLPGINGHTLLDPMDQSFGEKAIKDRLLKLPTPCSGQMMVLDTALIGYRDINGGAVIAEDKGYGRFERWNIRACGIEHTANLAILPDARTRYRYIARIE